MIAVFSSANAVTPCSGFTSSSCAGLDDSNPNTPRIPSVIDAGVDYDTGKTGLSEAASFDTDILEDFFVPTTGVQIIVPPGALYLWATPHDDKKSTGPYGHLYYGNKSNGGFSVGVELVTPAADSDGVGDALDNCVFDSNSGQEDADTNGVSDACEPFTGPNVPALPWVARLLLLGLLLIGGALYLRRRSSRRGSAT
jgi:hypothetical protein